MLREQCDRGDRREGKINDDFVLDEYLLHFLRNNVILDFTFLASASLGLIYAEADSRVTDSEIEFDFRLEI